MGCCTSLAENGGTSEVDGVDGWMEGGERTEGRKVASCRLSGSAQLLLDSCRPPSSTSSPPLPAVKTSLPPLSLVFVAPLTSFSLLLLSIS